MTLSQMALSQVTIYRYHVSLGNDKQLVWDVTVVDALAPSGLNQGSSCNPGTTATEAEARKIKKYRELIDNGYVFQLVALEVQGSLGKSSKTFITRLCKMLCCSHDD